MSVKKIIKNGLVCLFAASALLTGCSDSDWNNGKEQNSSNHTAEQNAGYVFEYKGTQIAMNAPMADILLKLGEPDDYFEADSCAFQGKDKVYKFGSVVITTYQKDSVDYVYTIQIKDDITPTPEKIRIGSVKQSVVEIYGTAHEDTGTAYVYTKDKSKLTFIFDDDKVSNITYMAIIEK